MEIAFETRALRTLCEDSMEAENAYGRALANELRRSLAELRAADTMFDMPATFDMPTGKQSEFAVPLGATHNLMLRCGNRRPPRLPSGEIDWDSVDRIKVIGVTKND